MNHPWVRENKQQIFEGITEYSRNPSVRKAMRLGQYIYNKFAPPGSEPWPELFYEEDGFKVVWMLLTECDSHTS